MDKTVLQIRQEIKKHADPQKGKFLQRFFKTGKGEYAEHDVFIGITVPTSRLIAKKYKSLPLVLVKKLLTSRIHEERLIALLILIEQFKKGDEQLRKKIYDIYLANTQYINNWDLIDLSADRIVGEFLFHEKEIAALRELAGSESMWERRIAIMATFAFIKKGESAPTFQLAELLLHDKHDLIHKAVGWLLREVGKRVSEEEEVKFLAKHYKIMPRTMLRYAIERFPQETRKKYLLGEI